MTDSTTLDLSASGTGTAADPYDITGAVILDPAPPGGGDQLLQAGPDGLFLEREQVRGCLVAGDGAAYDPAAGRGRGAPVGRHGEHGRLRHGRRSVRPGTGGPGGRVWPDRRRLRGRTADRQPDRRAGGMGRHLVVCRRDAFDADAGRLDVGHFVPLAEVFDSEQTPWSAERREAYANDQGSADMLIAVSAASNRSKSNKDPAQWMPSDASYHCTYAATWVATKLRWDLAMDDAERQALLGTAEDCSRPISRPCAMSAPPARSAPRDCPGSGPARIPMPAESPWWCSSGSGIISM
ncbi:HNH endonuclease family protein [[Kitasatospora] papulosa]|uniref:HNH endonuclease family protein n=1 Tax=[Kitasatospora] papulosa TaxID=1464011 RepID=UPI003634B2F4